MTDLSDIRRQAGRDTLLAALPEENAEEVFALGKPKRFRKGETLFQQGDAGDCAYLILSGAVKISIVSAAGREIVFAYLSVGDLVGDISVLDECPRTASATAAEPVDALVIHGADLQRQMADSPELSHAVIRFLCARLRATNELLESDRSFQTGPRLARGILRLLREHGHGGEHDAHLDFAINQTDLGAFVSLSRENVNRQLKDWARAGLLEVKAGKIIVKDREALEDAAEIEI
jgi:CRP/FNR family transcriptional regulator, cyclic AMP receptor protein